ncbi:hypothetical protein GB931_15395 [Modestobacter sp. I12A-02628]|uniref:Uncharacterized protein n=1 Tax=Goekera deserti TaxID=2497753 RepID=A0A7K3WJI6_9ACTN|nr:hypothetical protein [Goekera deserti]MPQ99277.1 hypothetical protein [Goekera deserti]NDI50276.1 hypothetical protein [Goekera deserti]NEL56472.1 hypothetical protein [Goekera deserti]
MLTGHALATGALAVVSAALLLTRLRGDGVVHPAWSVAWGAAALAVLVLAVRWVGVREPARRGYLWSAAGAWVLVPLTWTAALVGSLQPWGFIEAWLYLGIGFSPVLLALAVAGAGVAWSLSPRR